MIIVMVAQSLYIWYPVRSKDEEFFDFGRTRDKSGRCRAKRYTNAEIRLSSSEGEVKLDPGIMNEEENFIVHHSFLFPSFCRSMMLCNRELSTVCAKAVIN